MEFFVLRRGASVLLGDWPVLWRSLSLQSIGGPIGVSPVFIGWERLATFWESFLRGSSGCFAPAAWCVARK